MSELMHVNVFNLLYKQKFFLYIFLKGNKGEQGADGEAGQKGDQVKFCFIKVYSKKTLLILPHNFNSVIPDIIPCVILPTIQLFSDVIFMISIFISQVHCYTPYQPS